MTALGGLADVKYILMSLTHEAVKPKAFIGINQLVKTRRRHTNKAFHFAPHMGWI